uniref:Uncharacterized protein n=1 Tax=Alexandrium monilatum TaxID=311494 RepID=A0A7S4UA74_9DINO
MAGPAGVYDHRAMGELQSKERRVQEAYLASAKAVCSVYGTPRQHYRPVLGISGTLQATPNPCLEKDRRRNHDAPSMEHRRMVDSDPPWAARSSRGAEAELSHGVPPHQAHHHHFGWTPAGPKPEAAVFSARRPWGIGLRYSDDVVPSFRQIKQCPDSPRASENRRQNQSQSLGSTVRAVPSAEPLSPTSTWGSTSWRRRSSGFRRSTHPEPERFAQAGA